jgi:hypothetical protein
MRVTIFIESIFLLEVKALPIVILFANFRNAHKIEFRQQVNIINLGKEQKIQQLAAVDTRISCIKYLGLV